MSIVPYGPVEGAKKLLLKLHGCCSAPQDIVLTRRDFIRYGDNSAALGGLLQGLMLTKFFLYIGFSLEVRDLLVAGGAGLSRTICSG
jgi:hypothetical protein